MSNSININKNNSPNKLNISITIISLKFLLANFVIYVNCEGYITGFKN